MAGQPSQARFSTQIYQAWREKQFQKFEMLYPKIKPFLSSKSKVLDLGIGQAWLEEFLEGKGIGFEKTVGVDVSEEAVEPRRQGIEYFFSQNFQGRQSEEKFDLLVCFDSFHLLGLKAEELLDFLKPQGLALISLPLRWQEKLDCFPQKEILCQGEIGREEIDRFILFRKE